MLAVCGRQVLDVHPWHYEANERLSLRTVMPAAGGTQGRGVAL